MRYEMEVQQKNIWESSSVFRPLIPVHHETAVAGLCSVSHNCPPSSLIGSAPKVPEIGQLSSGLSQLFEFGNEALQFGAVGNQAASISSTMAGIVMSGYHDVLIDGKASGKTSSGMMMPGKECSGLLEEHSTPQFVEESDVTSPQYGFTLFSNWDHFQPQKAANAPVLAANEPSKVSGSNSVTSLDNAHIGAMKQAFDDLVSKIVNEDESVKSEPPKDEPFIASLKSAMGSYASGIENIWSAAPERKNGMSYPPGLNIAPAWSSVNGINPCMDRRPSTWDLKTSTQPVPSIKSFSMNENYFLGAQSTLFEKMNGGQQLGFAGGEERPNPENGCHYFALNKDVFFGKNAPNLSGMSFARHAMNGSDVNFQFADRDNDASKMNFKFTDPTEPMQLAAQYKSQMGLDFSRFPSLASQPDLDLMSSELVQDRRNRDEATAREMEYFAKGVSSRPGSVGCEMFQGSGFMNAGRNAASTSRMGLMTDVKPSTPPVSSVAARPHDISELQASVAMLHQNVFLSTASAGGQQNPLMTCGSQMTQACPIPVWQPLNSSRGSFSANAPLCFNDLKVSAAMNQIGNHPHQIAQKFASPRSTEYQNVPQYYGGMPVAKHSGGGTAFVVGGLPYRFIPSEPEKQEHRPQIGMENNCMRFSEIPSFEPQLGSQSARSCLQQWKGLSGDEVDRRAVHGDALTSYSVGRMTPIMFGAGGDHVYDSSSASVQSAYGAARYVNDGKYQRRLGASNELCLHLELCYDQLRLLETEEKEVDAELTKRQAQSCAAAAVGATPSVGSTMVVPRLPHNPSRVDHLVVESLREHAKMTATLARLKKLRCGGGGNGGVTIHANVYSVMERWMEGIRKVQARRKEEIVSTANRNHSTTTRPQNDKDVLALGSAINELLAQTRRTRTALWCALQMALHADVLVPADAPVPPLTSSESGEINFG